MTIEIDEAEFDAMKKVIQAALRYREHRDHQRFRCEQDLFDALDMLEATQGCRTTAALSP